MGVSCVYFLPVYFSCQVYYSAQVLQKHEVGAVHLTEVLNLMVADVMMGHRFQRLVLHIIHV